MSIMNLLLLLLGIIVLAVGVTWIFGTRSQSAKPPNLSHSDGNQSATTADAIADHSKSTQTGEIMASAAVDGNGSGNANAEVGHTFVYRGQQRKRHGISMVGKMRTRVEVTDEAARATAIVNFILVPNSHNFANDIQTTVGVKENPAGGGWTTIAHSFTVDLAPGDRITPLLEVSAHVDTPDPNDAGACSAKAEAKLEKITVVPH